MAPSSASGPVATGKSETGTGSARDNSRSATPTTPKGPLTGGNAAALGSMVKNSQLANALKSDFAKIKSLATCTICDQLLYEPWTIACGHTYCYSCLSTWFTQNHQNRDNSRVKTCPECRAVVKVNPAQNFLIKQMVHVIVKRPELLPADESIDQHQQRMEEEALAVENDRGSRAGLFKGYFTSKELRKPFYDEADDVMRCPSCNHEYEGGPACQVCGVEIDDDRSEFSDEGEIYSPGSINAESEADVAPEYMQRFYGHHHFGFSPGVAHLHYMHHYHHHNHAESDVSELANTEGSEGDSDEDDSSLREFVVPDDDEEPVRAARRLNRNNRSAPVAIEISDDDSDEGGAISNGRPRQRVFDLRSPSPGLAPAPSTNGSEAGESEAARLEYAGWSPLEPDSETEDTEDEDVRAIIGRRLPSRRHLGVLSESEDEDEQEHLDPRRFHGYSSLSDDDHNASDGSDTNTETMIGHGGSDDDDRSRTSLSVTPTYVPGVHRPDFHPFQYGVAPYSNSDADDDDSEAGGMDHDGDTDMSMSPRVSRPAHAVSPEYAPYKFSYHGSSAASTNYDGDATPLRMPSPSPPTQHIIELAEEERPATNGNFNRSIASPSWCPVSPTQWRDNSGFAEASVGPSVNVNENLADDGDSSPVRPAQRRRQPRQYTSDGIETASHSHHHRYDNRISQMFADFNRGVSPEVYTAPHQTRTEQSFSLDRENPYRIEPASNSHRQRRMTAYRAMPARRTDPLRSSRSPSATRVISSSTRSSRSARQYMDILYH